MASFGRCGITRRPGESADLSEYTELVAPPRGCEPLGDGEDLTEEEQQQVQDKRSVLENHFGERAQMFCVWKTSVLREVTVTCVVDGLRFQE